MVNWIKMLIGCQHCVGFDAFSHFYSLYNWLCRPLLGLAKSKPIWMSVLEVILYNCHHSLAVLQRQFLPPPPPPSDALCILVWVSNFSNYSSLTWSFLLTIWQLAEDFHHFEWLNQFQTEHIYLWSGKTCQGLSKSYS